MLVPGTWYWAWEEKTGAVFWACLLDMGRLDRAGDAGQGPESTGEESALTKFWSWKGSAIAAVYKVGLCGSSGLYVHSC